MNRCESIIERYELLEVKADEYSSKEALKYINDEISNMQWELGQSEKGKKSGVNIINPERGKGYSKYIDTSSKSTFPEYFQEIFNGQGTIKKFNDAVKRGKGKVFDRIKQVAIDRLEHGYKNAHGYDEPNKDFITLISDMDVPF